MYVGPISVFKHEVHVYNNVHSSAGGAFGIHIEQYCVISCNIMASMYS